MCWFEVIIRPYPRSFELKKYNYKEKYTTTSINNYYDFIFFFFSHITGNAKGI